MTVKQCAVLLGGSEEWVRSACKRGILGDAWHGEKQYPERWTYVISDGLVASWLGITVQELHNRVSLMSLKERKVLTDGQMP